VFRRRYKRLYLTRTRCADIECSFIYGQDRGRGEWMVVRRRREEPDQGSGGGGLTSRRRGNVVRWTSVAEPEH